MICMNCGKEIPDTAKFCPECGHPAGQQAISTTIVVNGVSIDLVELESRIHFLEDSHQYVYAVKDIMKRTNLSVANAKAVTDAVRKNQTLVDAILKKVVAGDAAFAAEADALSGSLFCPKCHSKRIYIEQKGYSLKKGILGALIVGPIGSLFGLHHASKHRYQCLDCGYKWKEK